MDDENPKCFLDGLIQHQRRETQTLGEPKYFTDPMLESLLSATIFGGERSLVILVSSLRMCFLHLRARPY